MSASTPGRIEWRAERDRIDLAAVATRLLGPAHGRRGEGGRKPWWPCPFHEDANPSFCIEPGKPWWRCYGCGERGDAASLVMGLEGLTFPEAVAHRTGAPARTPTPGKPYRGKTGAVASLSGGPGPPAGPRPCPEAPRPAAPSGMPLADALALVADAGRRLWAPEGADALDALHGRGLADATIRAARLGWTPSAEGVAWSPPGIVIPWWSGDALALVKLRPPEGWRDRFPEGRRPPKYLEGYRDPARLVAYPGPEAVRPGRPLVLVEGELDALLLGQELADLAGVLTLGSASARPTPAVLGSMLAAAPWFIATDADPAGDKAAGDWPPSARRVRPPGSFKDWTEAHHGGVNLSRWWRAVLAGDARPPLFDWEELAGWRWGPAVGDSTPGIIA